MVKREVKVRKLIVEQIQPDEKGKVKFDINAAVQAIVEYIGEVEYRARNWKPDPRRRPKK